MKSAHKAYLIIPKLIEQPTWGGNYILSLKKLLSINNLRNKKIGQSYELFGQSKLHLTLHDSTNTSFLPEFGFADKPDISAESKQYKEGVDSITLENLVKENPSAVLGKDVLEKFGKMPLLIKINQAFGNSFQLHIKPGVSHPHWKSKPESWYYLEDGLITFGIKKNCNLEAYKKACFAIDDYMKYLSNKVMNKSLALEDAKKEAKKYIENSNPWQFINVHEVKKFDLIDLSIGGLHHSWEENKQKFPQGNVVYEVQQDVMDPVSTIRSFDQGKIKDDGSIRKIAIEDYFKLLDTDPTHNNLDNMRQSRKGTRLLTTDYYCLDILEVQDVMTYQTENSFNHLFVREGCVEIKTEENTLKLSSGHSCFLPQQVGSYIIKAVTPSIVLKTFIE